MSLDKCHLKNDIIIPALKEIGLHSESAVNLLMGTCAQESHMGKYTRQILGPAVGIYQMEPFTFNDLFERRKKYLVKANLDLSKRLTAERLVTDNKLATIMCRLKYLDAPEPLPDALDIEALGQYWKKYYNSYLGKGKVSEFVKNYETFVQMD